MSPDLMFDSIKREIIFKKADVFKSAVLRDVKNIFSYKYPFYAGFGNRESDATAYRMVDVELINIFIIDEHSVI